MVVGIFDKQKRGGLGWSRFSPLLAAGGFLTLILIGAWGCTQETSEDKVVSDNSPSGQASSMGVSAQAGAPLVTMEHWKNSTPGERYAFIIGFVTMLELEKEWQGREGQGILSFEESLVPSWVEGFAHRPLEEIYKGLNRHTKDYPGELNRPVAEVMWFSFIKPNLKTKVESKEETKVESKVESKDESKIEAESKIEPKVESKIETKVESKIEIKLPGLDN